MNFPAIEHIDDILPHIAGRSDFVVAEREGYTVIDYIFEGDDTFDDPVRMECRGITFDAGGRIIRRPLRKFWNLNQKPGVLSHEVDFTKPHSVTRKEDGCLHGDARIEFTDGSFRTMREIVSKKLVGPVWGVAGDSGVVPVDIVGWSRLPRVSGWKTIVVDDPKNSSGRCVSATNDHLIMTDRGWVEAASLEAGDRLVRKAARFSRPQKSVVLGCLLGDMSLQLSGGAKVLQWSHKVAHSAYNDLIASILEPFHTNRRVGLGGWGTERDMCHCCCAEPLDEIRDLTYEGTKIVSERWLSELDDVSVAFWYMDDGSLSRGIPAQRPRAMFHTEGFDEESIQRIVAFFRRWLGANPAIASYRGYKAIRLNADDAERLWSRIAPYVARCMRYKLPEKYRSVPCHWDTFIPSRQGCAGTVSLRVARVEDGAGERRTSAAVRYDIQTSSGNFFANKVLVHNSMISPAAIGGRVTLMTRMGHTDVARKAERLLTDGIEAVLKNIIDDGITPIFEFTGPDNRIVVRYDEPRLTLLAARHMITGEYLSLREIDLMAQDLGLPLVEHYPSDWTSAADFLAYARAVTGMEGFVVRFDDGLWVKAKGDDYVLKHKAKDSILREKNVLAMVLGGQLDDVLPPLDEPDRGAIISYRDEVARGIEGAADTVARIVEAGAGLDQKAFAVDHLAGISPVLRSLAFTVRTGVAARDAVISMIARNLGSQTDVDSMRFLHGARWAAGMEMADA